jgi:hypothetical protein
MSLRLPEKNKNRAHVNTQLSRVWTLHLNLQLLLLVEYGMVLYAQVSAPDLEPYNWSLVGWRERILGQSR